MSDLYMDENFFWVCLQEIISKINIVSEKKDLRFSPVLGKYQKQSNVTPFYFVMILQLNINCTI